MQLQEDVLHVLAHIARLGERGGVRDGERHLERARERLGQKRLAGAGGAEEHDVALGQLHVPLFGIRAQADALVVVVHGHRKGALGLFLAHHVLGKVRVQLVRGRQASQHGRRVGRVRHGRAGMPARPVAGMAGGSLRGHALGHIVGEVVVLRQVQAQIAHHGVGAHRDALVADVDAVRARDHGRDLLRRLPAERARDVRGIASEAVVFSIVDHRCYSPVCASCAPP